MEKEWITEGSAEKLDALITGFIQEHNTNVFNTKEQIHDFIKKISIINLCFSTYNADFDKISKYIMAVDKDEKIHMQIIKEEKQHNQNVLFQIGHLVLIQEDKDPYKTAIAFETKGEIDEKELMIINEEETFLEIVGRHAVLVYHPDSIYTDENKKKELMGDYFGLYLGEDNLDIEVLDVRPAFLLSLNLPEIDYLLPDIQNEGLEDAVRESKRHQKLDDIKEAGEKLTEHTEQELQHIRNKMFLEMKKHLKDILKKYDLISCNDDYDHLKLTIDKGENHKKIYSAVNKMREFYTNAAIVMSEDEKDHILDFWMC